MRVLISGLSILLILAQYSAGGSVKQSESNYKPDQDVDFSESIRNGKLFEISVQWEFMNGKIQNLIEINGTHLFFHDGKSSRKTELTRERVIELGMLLSTKEFRGLPSGMNPQCKEGGWISVHLKHAKNRRRICIEMQNPTVNQILVIMEKLKAESQILSLKF
jgi:hypothetical protein